MRILGLFSLFLISFSLRSQQLMINEVSQGPGSSEYVEFVVAGSATCATPVPCLNLRTVIIDDNNGYFAPGAGTGIAAGAVRFADIPFWQCVPQGTIIVIYNDQAPNPLLPANDLSLSDGNCTLIIPASSTLLEKTTVSPTTTVSTYPGGASWTSGGNWSPLAMSNSDDSFQLPNPITGTPNHAVSWGNNSNGTIIYFAGSAGGKVFSFTNSISNNWSTQANWTSGDVGINETPGVANSANNSQWISSMNPQCGTGTGMNVTLNGTNETCVNACDGAISSVVSGGTSPYAYNWSTGNTTNAITDLCPGVYTLEVTSANGCSVTESITITQGPAVADATIQNAGPFFVTDPSSTIIPVNNGGSWNSTCGTCLSSSGVFDPQIAGVGVWQVCYTLGTGSCTNTSCIFIEVLEDCQPQITNEEQYICAGDSISIFGNWETVEGEYIETYMDQNGCDSTHFFQLTYYPAEPIMETIILCQYDSVEVFGTYYLTSTTVSQTEQTVQGCSYEHTVQIVLEDCTIEPAVVFIPNVFTPNNDLVNDTFKLEVLGGLIEEGFILNRWGNIIYSLDEHKTSWDGTDETSGMMVQDGVYTYVIYFKPAESPRETYHGFVTVIR